MRAPEGESRAREQILWDFDNFFFRTNIGRSIPWQTHASFVLPLLILCIFA